MLILQAARTGPDGSRLKLKIIKKTLNLNGPQNFIWTFESGIDFFFWIFGRAARDKVELF